MARNIIIGVLTFVLVSFSSMTYAQWSLGGGVSSFHGLNLPIHRFGFNAFAEFPRSTNNSFLVRAVYALPHKDNDIGEFFSHDGVSSVMGDVTRKSTYFAVDGGSRLYLFNDYDIGTAMYVGGYAKGILTMLSASYYLPPTVNVNDFNTNVYYSDGAPVPIDNVDKPYSLLFAFGGTIGVKHQLPRGAITLDAGIELLTPLINQAFVFHRPATFSQLSFSLNLAYRFDFF